MSKRRKEEKVDPRPGVLLIKEELSQRRAEVGRLTAERDSLRSRLVELQRVAIEPSNDVDAGDGEPKSKTWDASQYGGQAYEMMSAKGIVAWVNRNGGEALYAPVEHDDELTVIPACIAIRTSRPGWVYAKPGDTIVMGDKPVRLVREFSVRPAGVEESSR